MTSRIVQSPIDSGYSWVIVIAVFFAHVLQYGFTWTVGVWYTVFMEEFQMQSKYIALISSLNTAAFYAAGPISSFLTNLYGARPVCIWGSVIGVLGLVSCGFVHNIFMLYLTFGVLTGVGFGIAYIPGVSMVGHYFEKRRSLAMGFAVSGCGIGTFVFPMMINVLISHYSFRGALIIIAAVMLNMLVLASLYRPWTGERYVEIEVQQDEDDQLPETNNRDDKSEILISQTRLKFPIVRHISLSKPSLNVSKPSLLPQSLRGSNATINSLALRKKIISHGSSNLCRNISICDLQSNGICNSKHSVAGSYNLIISREGTVLGSRSLCDGHHFQTSAKQANHKEDVESNMATLPNQTSSFEPKANFIGKLQLQIFRNIGYLMLCCNNLLFCFGLSVVYVHLGSYAKEILQLTNAQSSTFFSALGISNFIGRFAFGAICQVPKFKPMWVYSTAFLMTGIITVLCPLRNDYIWVMTYAVMFGLLSGSFGALLPSVIIQVTDLNRLNTAYGYLLIFEAVGTLIGAPLAGLIIFKNNDLFCYIPKLLFLCYKATSYIGIGMLYDVTTVYNNSFYLGGCFMVLSVIVMIYPLKYSRTEAEIEKELEHNVREMVQEPLVQNHETNN